MDRPLQDGVENVYLATVMRRVQDFLLKNYLCQQNLIRRHAAVGWHRTRQLTIVCYFRLLDWLLRRLTNCVLFVVAVYSE